MWRNIRIAILLLILGIAAYSNWYDRLSTTDWDETLYIGVFPIDDAGNEVTRDYIARLSADHVADIEQFLNREAHRYGITIDRPVRVDLYPPVEEKPPERASDSNMLQNMWWSLKLRMYARRAVRAAGKPPPQIRIFVRYHDPSFTRSVPHSVGMQKGLVGVVHAFADRSMTRTNNVVIAHEILHTLGASDKYDPATLAPLYPDRLRGARARTAVSADAHRDHGRTLRHRLQHLRDAGFSRRGTRRTGNGARNPLDASRERRAAGSRCGCASRFRAACSSTRSIARFAPENSLHCSAATAPASRCCCARSRDCAPLPQARC